MKTATSTLVFIFIFLSSCRSQTQPTLNTKDLKEINAIFDRIEVQGVETKQDLLYGYFFVDKDESKLKKLESDLIAQAYRVVELEKKESGNYLLHVEKIEKHTRQSLQEREHHLRLLAVKHGVSSFDGFDVGNADPAKPLVSDEGFARFMATKKGTNLFSLGTKLYDLEINDKAELVFSECLKKNIKPDTSAFKLGNTLIAENKTQQGIDYLLLATKFNPNYFEALFNLGAACYDSGQFQKSIEYYQQADKLKPNEDRIAYGIAASQYALHRYEESLANCRKALQLNKDNDYAKQLLQMLRKKTK